MRKRSEPASDADALREKVIGFGERSARRSFYPELRDRLAALEESEARFRAVFEGAAIGIAVVDLQGNLKEVNREFEALLARRADELRGRAYASLIHPDDRAVFASVQAEIARGDTDRLVVEVRLQRPDGDVMWGQVSASLVSAGDGSPAYIVAAVQDVTVRKRAREGLEFLSRASVRLATSLDIGGTLENLAALAIPFLADFCVISTQARDTGPEQRLVAARDATQKAAADELLSDRSIADVFAGHASGTAPWLVCNTSGALPTAARDQGAAFCDAVRRLELRSVIVVPFEADRSHGTLVLATTSSGRRYGPFDLELATEFANRAALALENATLLLRANEASRLKDEFLAVVSHELRTPLTSILGWLHLLQAKRMSGAKAERGLSVIDRNARALAQIIDDLLGVSHIVAGKLSIRAKAIELAPVIAQAVEALLPAAAEAGVAIHVNCEAGVPPVMGDAARLQQVVWNLVSNGVKYTPAGGEVRVRLVRAESKAMLTVADTGRGINPQFLPHVFERFRQEDGSATRTHGGLGLGLAIARHLVDLHGGTVAAASSGEGHGACMTVTLPLACEVGSAT
jgi:PAS domain S-box-containing protein